MSLLKYSPIILDFQGLPVLADNELVLLAHTGKFYRGPPNQILHNTLL